MFSGFKFITLKAFGGKVYTLPKVLGNSELVVYDKCILVLKKETLKNKFLQYTDEFRLRPRIQIQTNGEWKTINSCIYIPRVFMYTGFIGYDNNYYYFSLSYIVLSLFVCGIASICESYFECRDNRMINTAQSFWRYTLHR